jgi:diadenosine tetraphosphate (Ap4A) HIT family hydrolase
VSTPACEGCARVGEAGRGGRGDLIAAFEHSILLLGGHQAYPGYCVLWSRAHAKELHQLPLEAYRGFHDEARRVGAALEAGLKPWKLNVVSLGNVVQHAHLHFFPRYADDPDREKQPWVKEAQFTPLSPEESRAWVQRLKGMFP